MKSITGARVTLGVALGVLVWEVTLGGGRPAVLSTCVTLILLGPAAALDAWRRAASKIATPPDPEEPPR